MAGKVGFGWKCGGVPQRIKQTTEVYQSHVVTIFTYRCTACGKEAEENMPEYSIESLDMEHEDDPTQ